MIFAFLTAFISGFSIFLNKFGVKGINPFIFTGLKNTLVAIFLFTLILATKDAKILKKLTKKNWLTLISIGLLGGSIPFLLFFKGLSLTTASQAAFIHKNMFLFIAILAPLLLKEKLNKNFFIAICFLFLGNALLFTKPSFDKGSLFVFAATLLWALESILSKKILSQLPAKIVAWGRMFFGSFFIILFLAFTGKIQLITNLQPNAFLWIALTSVFLLGYVFCWYSALKRIRVSTAACILTLGAPITNLLSVFSGKILNPQQIISILFLFIGIIVLCTPSNSLLATATRQPD